MIVLVLPVLGIVAMVALFALFMALWPVIIILVALALVLFGDRSWSRKPSNAKIPGPYEPKWGAYVRRIVANEKFQWQEEFDRALQAADGPMGEHRGAWQKPFDALGTSKDRQVR